MKIISIVKNIAIAIIGLAIMVVIPIFLVIEGTKAIVHNEVILGILAIFSGVSYPFLMINNKYKIFKY